jgi:ribosome biogenesis GTPase
MNITFDLPGLGWKAFFQQQLSLEEWETSTVNRVLARDRSSVQLLGAEGRLILELRADMTDLATGDWVLLGEGNSYQRRLERSTLFSRKAAGTRAETQIIAVNVDTAFIVSSMNRDFNLNRIERYLALANEAGVTPVLVLTKLDLCDEPEPYVAEAQTLDSSLMIVAVNGLDPESVSALSPWCGVGNTVVFLGSSGVGKSTLINTLFGEALQLTHGTREDDDKGRHTTTGRTLHLMPGGGLLLDTPGMRELQLAACEHGIEETFAEITELAERCRFSDCLHQAEPGCAVRNALDSGQIDPRRLANYHKLMKEQAFNEATLAEKREKDRKLGRYYRSVLSDQKRMKSE